METEAPGLVGSTGGPADGSAERQGAPVEGAEAPEQ